MTTVHNNANGDGDGDDENDASFQFQNSYIAQFKNRPLESLTLTTLRTKADPPDKVDLSSLVVPERGYPKVTHLVDYPTSAAETEIEKHDRLLVQGMYFMKTQDFTKFHYDNVNDNAIAITNANANANDGDADGASKTVKKVCLNIYLCNRRIPYINSLIMGLSSFSTKENELDMNKAEIHLLNTEKRTERLHFKYMRETLSKLPFVHKVHNITYRDEIYANITDRELEFREMFISDEISGLKICIESGLPYCIMMEEDAIVPVDFMTLLHSQIIDPLEKGGHIRIDGSGAISVLSLYSYYNLVVRGTNRLHHPEYTKRYYPQDVAKTNAERFSQDLPPYTPEYNILEYEYMYGTVAMMYTRDSAIKCVEYLQKVGVNPIHNADEFMNAEVYFPATMGIPRKHVEPSLVNHIGYYSERMADFTARGMFSQLNTDSRFMFDAGDL